MKLKFSSMSFKDYFAPHCVCVLYILAVNLLDHLLENLERPENMSSTDAALFGQSNVLIRQS